MAECTEELAKPTESERVKSRRQDKVSKIKKALVYFDSMGPELQNEVESLNASCTRSQPLTLFKFCVGEHPRLPLFGRHFKSCASKLLCNSREVLKSIFKILDKHLPGHVIFWSELDDDVNADLYGEDAYSFKKYFLSSRVEESKDREEFYSRLAKVFMNVTTVEGIHRAREVLAVGGDIKDDRNICWKCHAAEESTKLYKCRGCKKVTVSSLG